MQHRTCSTSCHSIFPALSFLALGFLVLGVVSSFLSCPTGHSQEHAKSQQTYTIGAALPLTGPLAWVGQSMQRGIALAAHEASQDQSNPSIRVLYQDDLSFNRPTIVSIYKLFTSVHNVDVALNCSTSTISALAPIVSQEKLPTVVLWDSNRDMPSLSPQFVGFGYSNETAAEEAADFLVTKKGRKKIAVISFVNDWSQLLTRSFLDRARALGATITLSEQVEGNTTDFRSILAKAKQAGSDGIYLPLFGAGLVAAIKQVRVLKFGGTILTVDSLGDDELKDCGEAADGIFLSQIFLQDRDFLRRLTQLYPDIASSSVTTGYSALAYDGTRFVIEALKLRDAAASAPESSLLQLLKGRKFLGTLGDVLISEEGIADRSIPILEIRAGKFMPVQN